MNDVRIAINILSYVKAVSTDPDLIGAIHLALGALEKQIPKTPEQRSWAPALCPSCKSELSESICDGYYRDHCSLKVCDCGQKLKWG